MKKLPDWQRFRIAFMNTSQERLQKSINDTAIKLMISWIRSESKGPGKQKKPKERLIITAGSWRITLMPIIEMRPVVPV